MFMQQTDRLAVNPVREVEARSIGSILGEMREVALLRKRGRTIAPRNALRRNSA